MKIQVYSNPAPAQRYNQTSVKYNLLNRWGLKPHKWFSQALNGHILLKTTILLKIYSINYQTVSPAHCPGLRYYGGYYMNNKNGLK